MEKRFGNRSVNDYLEDDHFFQWVKHPDEESDAYWEKIKKGYPLQTKNIAKAKHIITILDIEKQVSNPESREKVWQRLQASIRREQRKRETFRHNLQKIAAVFVGVIIVGLSVFYYLRQLPIKIHTGYGEMTKVVLPDNSVVTLNGNSTLSYPKSNWDDNGPREVWIEGEAYFHVIHLHKKGTPLQSKQRFLVHTDDATIEVLGTRFNVSDRRDVTRVVLTKGKVAVEIQELPQKKALLENAGDMLEYNAETKTLTKSEANPKRYSLWTVGELVFDKTPFSEIIKYIEDNYGYKVVLEDKGLKKRTLTGTISTESEEVLFKALSSILNIDIRADKKANKLYIQKK